MSEIVPMENGAEFDRPSLEVISTVADREDCQPSELRPPLYSVIDPETLDRLWGSSSAARHEVGGSVSFAYCGYDVTVASDGTVSVEARSTE
ncbi:MULTISPECIES: HalOD1 output domain-containing protein [Natrialbaceae]|uniref:HalOD1 output domain-containing protein n=1 Tax=Natrialbaceae TaxID=1644061 RepID=UPI00207C599D|nr:HalOD1 output domain-containing protein [Natronococcus sp. CG52]